MAFQLNLFNQPTLNVARPLKEAMARAAKDCGLSVEEVLDRMNELAERYGVRLQKGNGKKLTLETLYKWINPDDLSRIIPAKALPVFCAVVKDSRPLDVLVEPLGFRVIGEKESRLLEWAEEYQRAKGARQKMRKLEAEI